MEAELESMTRKSHDASGQLVHISQELLKKERYRKGPTAPPTGRKGNCSPEHCGSSRLTELLVLLLKPGV